MQSATYLEVLFIHKLTGFSIKPAKLFGIAETKHDREAVLGGHVWAVGTII